MTFPRHLTLLRRLLTLACAAIAALTLATAASTPGPASAETTPTSTAHACAWLVPWAPAATAASLDGNASLLGEASPFWFDLTTHGRIGNIEGSSDAALLATLTGANVRVMPTIMNHFDPVRAHRMLRTSALRTAHAAAITALVVARGYDGIDVDYENLQPGDRDRFTAFVTQLASDLHAEGKLLSITVMARTATVSYNGASAEDYAAIGAAADRVRVMAYDYHYAGGSPGPIAPLPWVREVVSYAASQIDPSKVQLGVPLYGYLWAGGHGPASSVTYVQARKVAARAHARVRFSATFQEPYAVWHRRHHPRMTMWFENAAAVDAKLDVVDEYGLGGICMWRAGDEDPEVWTSIAARWGTPGT